MMKKGWIHISLLSAAMLCFGAPFAQVTVRASSDRNKILIGEPVSIVVEAYVPLGADLKWFPPDSIEHFLVTTRSPVDTINNIDGKKITQTLTVTSFDSGHWAVSPFEIDVAGKPYYSDSIPIDVGFSSFDPKADYRDIKDIIASREERAGFIPWVVAGIALLALALIYFLWFRKRKPQVRTVTTHLSRLSAYEKAMQDLAALKKKGSLGNEKGFYSEINDVLRTYVAEKFRMSTFERTNEELITQLSALNLPRKSFDSLTHSLRISDFVKFAKYRPAEEDNLANLDTVRTSIDLLNEQPARAV